MEPIDNDFSPQESFDLIQRVIDKTRTKYEENGFLITLWGGAVVIAGIAQFIMVKNGLGKQSGFAWLFTMVPLFIFNFIYGYNRKKKSPASVKTTDSASWGWTMAGSMAMLTGFVFGNHFGDAFTTAMFLPFCVAALVSGINLRKPFFVIMSVLAACLAYGALYVPWIYHSLVASSIAFILFFIPGLILRSDYKKRQRV